jgi:hypothetical protein
LWPNDQLSKLKMSAALDGSATYTFSKTVEAELRGDQKPSSGGITHHPSSENNQRKQSAKTILRNGERGASAL